MEECSEDPWTDRQIVDSWVVKIENNDQKNIDKVKNEENAEQDQGRRATEEQGIAASRGSRRNCNDFLSDEFLCTVFDMVQMTRRRKTG